VTTEQAMRDHSMQVKQEIVRIDSDHRADNRIVQAVDDSSDRL
jgi:hypothetical protein